MTMVGSGPRGRQLMLVIAFAALLTGCVTTHFDPEPKAPVALDGVWKLNRATSDDPGKVIDKLREAAMKIIKHYSPPQQQQPMMGGGGGGRGRRGQGGGQGQSQGPAQDDPQVNDEQYARQHFHGDPLKDHPVLNILNQTLSRGEFLTIKHTDDEMLLDYGTSKRRFTPGGHSVVSAEGGVADQTSGWKGKSYVVDIRPQLGPRSTEEYSLSDDGKHLIMKLHIQGGELPNVDLTRVYDPTHEVVPRALPSNE